jgi:hypothetical protein
MGVGRIDVTGAIALCPAVIAARAGRSPRDSPAVAKAPCSYSKTTSAVGDRIDEIGIAWTERVPLWPGPWDNGGTMTQRFSDPRRPHVTVKTA